MDKWIDVSNSIDLYFVITSFLNDFTPGCWSGLKAPAEPSCRVPTYIVYLFKLLGILTYLLGILGNQADTLQVSSQFLLH